MKQFPLPHVQRGATLVVGLIMLVLITVMVTSAFTLSNSNFKAVGNMQVHVEAIAAANTAIERVVTSWNFSSTPSSVAGPVPVDLDGSGNHSYQVQIAVPVCVSSTGRTGSAYLGSDTRNNLDATTSTTDNAAIPNYDTVWELNATATATGTNTSVQVHQGIGKTLTQAQCDAVCPPAAGPPCV